MKNFYTTAFNVKSAITTNDVVMVFDGDSLTEGTNNAGISQYYPKEVEKHFNPFFDSLNFYSYGVSGQTTRQMLSDASSQIYSKVDSNKDNVLIAWEEANAILQLDNGYDNSNKVTAQENFDDMVTYFQGAKDAGYNHLIIITGYLPRKSTNGNYEISSYTIYPSSVDEMEVYCDLVANADINTVPWDYHIDLRNTANIGGAKGQTKDVSFFNDYIHLQKLGYDEIVNEVIPVISNIFNI
jgi:lysophospholipase L1-like esterase